MEGLRESYWIDEATRTVAVQFVVLNGQQASRSRRRRRRPPPHAPPLPSQGLWGWVSTRTDFSRGGRGVPSSFVGSVQVQPYYWRGAIQVRRRRRRRQKERGGLMDAPTLFRSQGGIIVCDVVVMLYWLYLVAGTTRRLGAILLVRDSSGAAKARGVLS